MRVKRYFVPLIIYMTEEVRREQICLGGAGGVYTLVGAHSGAAYSILAAKRSEHESVLAACAARLYLLTPAAYHGCNNTPHLVIFKYSKQGK